MVCVSGFPNGPWGAAMIVAIIPPSVLSISSYKQKIRLFLPWLNTFSVTGQVSALLSLPSRTRQVRVPPISHSVNFN